MDSCGTSFVKYLLFVFNFLFAVSGLGIILTGAFVLYDVGDYKRFMDSGILAPPVILIVVGAIVFIVAFLGCFGAIRENSNLLITFAVCLLVIFVIELAVGIAVVVYKQDFSDALRNSLQDSMGHYARNKDEQMAWDTVQQRVKCCGVSSPADWTILRVGTPSSCVDKQTSVPHLQGCYEKVKEKVRANAEVLTGVGIGIAFVQIIGIVLACWLACKIRNDAENAKSEG